MYFKRIIDEYIQEWARKKEHKPLLVRGARQVGKSSAVRFLGKSFKTFLEINFEKQPEYKAIFHQNLVVDRIVSQISAMSGTKIEMGKTLLFFDEIQECPEAIMSLRFFKEDLPELHVIAAGSLLEFALQEIPTFGVGRIHSIFMHPMTFDEFLTANGQNLLLQEKQTASQEKPLSEPLHIKLVELFRTYMLVGGMPEVVSKWVSTHNFLQCQEIQDDILVSYEDDFSKYKKKTDPTLMRLTFRGLVSQITKKFVYSQISSEYKTEKIKSALELLILAGLAIPVTRTGANGIPLGSEADKSCQKMLLLDSGLALRLLNMETGDISEITRQILTGNPVDLVNKGQLAEMIAGLEYMRYLSPNLRHELYYWVRQERNSQAEIDYVTAKNGHVLPIEIKAETQGGMKSLWLFMREKKLQNALRCSLENFGEYDFVDKDYNTTRHVKVFPLYAIREMVSSL